MSESGGRGEGGKMTPNKNTAKRRRSGIDMVNGNNKAPVFANGHSESEKPIIRTRLPKISKSNRASGVWSRKISPAGIQYLKMDDEVGRKMFSISQFVSNTCLLYIFAQKLLVINLCCVKKLMNFQDYVNIRCKFLPNLEYKLFNIFLKLHLSCMECI